MAGRQVVVTGGAAGIGLAVARRLVDAGDDVVVLARSPERGQAAVDGLGGRARLVVGDLGTVAGVRDAAAAVLDACPALDVLVHNAGVWPSRRVLTEDGVEQAFATNHLAPFLLSRLLEPRLLASGARVVQVSAGIYVKGRVDPERTATGQDFSSIRTYADTKLANLLLLPLWARRWEGTGVTVNAVHPGVIRTGLGDRGGSLGLVLRLVKRGWGTPEEGAAPVVRLATDPALAGVSGRYWEVDDQVVPTPLARDEALAARLWQQAEQLTGVAATA